LTPDGGVGIALVQGRRAGWWTQGEVAQDHHVRIMNIMFNFGGFDYLVE
jgi:hypothetical protein